MFDLIIRGGTVVDGTGSPGVTADVGVRDGRIAAVGADLGAEAADVIDAAGAIVTPGFVDVHTHYDGQATWDDLLEPTSNHGVTTLVMGNCGVGFAPVAPGREEWLVQLMEGVEDIPGTALHEGITWGWESFPQYLDLLDSRSYAVDVAAYVGHGPVRAYVMGDRGARNEPATPEDIARMAALVSEAMDAGAVGFSSSRTLNHKARDGEPVPGSFAAMDELSALAGAVARAGHGVFEVAPQGMEFDRATYTRELAMLGEVAAAQDVPVSFLVLQHESDPDMWRMALDTADASGGSMRPQVAARPFGMMLGWEGYHFFAKRPTFAALATRMRGEELLAELLRPAVRAAILSEADLPPDPTVQFDGIGAGLAMMLHKVYAMGTPPDYEPTADRTVAAIAAERGVDSLAAAYDLMCEDGGKAFLMLPFFNYAEGNHDAIYEMLAHPATVSALSDGGAHCRMICDASTPTYVVSHWGHGRSRGKHFTVEQAVRMQTKDTADFIGFADRGTIAVGKRADLNVIDLPRLGLAYPRAVNDLPAGGVRLVQDATGYRATVVGGAITRRHGVDTGARPGRLVRSHG
jgi:N-acyl-D-aspartate/D-glutamate deacylase